MPLTAGEIATQLDGQVLGDPSLVLTGFAPADKARPGDLTFAENETYFQRAEQIIVCQQRDPNIGFNRRGGSLRVHAAIGSKERAALFF